MSSILKYAGKYRRHIFTALVLISISVPIGVVPYFLISGLIGKYISEAAVMADVVRTSVLILICFTVKYILYGEGLNLSHEGAFGTLYNMRVKLADELMHQPLGEVADGGTGKYKKSFVEEIGRIELMLAHMLPEGIPNLIMPFIVLAVIFATDWRMGLLSLASLPFGIIGMGMMMRGSAACSGAAFLASRSFARKSAIFSQTASTERSIHSRSGSFMDGLLWSPRRPPPCHRPPQPELRPCRAQT